MTIRIASTESASRVVQLPERAFPGYVVQGDKLFTWFEMAEAARSGDDESAKLLSGEILSALQSYKRTLMAESLNLPFPDESIPLVEE